MSKASLFNDDWLKLQQQYWENLSDMGRKAMGMETPKQNPWEAAMDQWWKTLSPAAPDPSRAFMDQLMEQGKSYFSTLEQFTKGLGTTTDATQAWGSLNKTFEEMQRGFAEGFKGGEEGMRRLMGFWEMPLDNWQRTLSSLSPMMPGDWLRNMPHDQMKDQVNRALSAPGLGYSREEQGQYKELMRAGMEYQQALQEYMGFFSQMGVKSVERMRGLVQEKAESEQPIDSGRVLYDSWVKCCEDVYAKEVAQPEYARIHGQLVNAQMALKKRMSVMVDENLGALNMPTRTEVRTLQDRLQETRRENKRLRHDLGTLQRQVESLRSQMMTLGRSTSSTGAAETTATAPSMASSTASASAAAPRSAATKKKAAPRKKAATKTSSAR